ncbi:MAG: hypothetical protein Q7S99_09155 [Parvibaculum sp.]|nr:hypothetical protein [Parvibaculum sp.]
MTATQTATWTGASGKKYQYYVYKIGTKFKAVPANYIYTKISAANTWVPIYIGETSDLSVRILDTHHQRDCILRNGATHIHVHKSSATAQVRIDEETDLRKAHKPPCNQQ